MNGTPPLEYTEQEENAPRRAGNLEIRGHDIPVLVNDSELN